MSINAIKTNLLGIQQAKTNVKTDVKEENSSVQKSTTKTTHKQISADDVFKYMSATNTVSVKMKKTVNVSKHVTAESASRISSSIKDFEAQFANKLSSVKSEFENISDDLAEKIALSMF